MTGLPNSSVVSHAAAVKSVSLIEEQIDEYFPGYPVLSPTFVLEGMAQCGGLLLGQLSDFNDRVVLAKVAKSKMHFYPRPGDQLNYHVTLETSQADGGLVKGSAHIGERVQCEAELTFAIVGDEVTKVEFFEPAEFLRMLRIFCLFEVGVDKDGHSIQIPARLAKAEAAEWGG